LREVPLNDSTGASKYFPLACASEVTF